MKNELALMGGHPIRNKPFTSWPIFGKKEKQLLLEVLNSGNWSFDGPKEKEFSKCFANFCDAKYAICVSNGTVSLEIALRALGIGIGDEVIVPALTWTATAWAVLQVGATPVFADVNQKDWCIDPDSIKKRITRRTKAIIPVHLYNQVAEMDKILKIAKKHSLKVIEDCAHMHGSQWKNKGIGTLGDVGSFSFQQSKVMTSGEGGALITNNEGLAKKIYSLKNCGRPLKEGINEGIGGNYRVTEFQAAILIAQLERLEKQLKKKIENVKLFKEKIKEIPGIKILNSNSKITRQGMYALTLNYNKKEFCNIPRKILIDALHAEGIPAIFPYPVVYQSPLWKSGKKLLKFRKDESSVRKLGLNSKCPVAERISNQEGLIIYHNVFLGSQIDIQDLVAGFRKLYQNSSELRHHLFFSIKRKIQNSKINYFNNLLNINKR